MKDRKKENGRYESFKIFTLHRCACKQTFIQVPSGCGAAGGGGENFDVLDNVESFGEIPEPWDCIKYSVFFNLFIQGDCKKKKLSYFFLRRRKEKNCYELV